MRRGATVVASARNAAALEAFAQSHERGEALPLDATDRDAVQAAAQKIIDRHGRIDLVMYCAGHYKPQRATAYDVDEMLKHQQINFTGAYLVLGAVLPQLLRQAAAKQTALVSLVVGEMVGAPDHGSARRLTDTRPAGCE